jgi:hypothetical protein
MSMKPWPASPKRRWSLRRKVAVTKSLATIESPKYVTRAMDLGSLRSTAARCVKNASSAWPEGSSIERGGLPASVAPFGATISAAAAGIVTSSG